MLVSQLFEINRNAPYYPVYLFSATLLDIVHVKVPQNNNCFFSINLISSCNSEI